MSLFRAAAVASVLTFGATVAHAQTVAIRIRDGRVTLDARGASVRQILSEWARVGGSTIVNGEQASSLPVTLLLFNVPERTALEVLLRGESGYIAVRRVAHGAQSSLDQIVLFPVSSVAVSASSTTPPGRFGGEPAVVGIDPNDGRFTDPNARPDLDRGTPQLPGLGPLANGGQPPVQDAREALLRLPPNVPGAPPVRIRTGGPEYPDPPAAQLSPSGQIVQAPANPFGISVSSLKPGVELPSPAPRPPQDRPGTVRIVTNPAAQPPAGTVRIVTNPGSEPSSNRSGATQQPD